VVEAYLKKQVESLLEQVELEQAERMERENNFKYKVPLVRLKIEYREPHSVINIARFGEQFKHRLANRNNFLHFWRRSPESVQAQQKRQGIETKAEKDYLFVYNHEEPSAGQSVSLFNTLDKIITLQKHAVPHFSVDSLNFKKLLRNCVDKNQNMEHWYDNFYA